LSVHFETFSLETKGEVDVLDVTPRVAKAVANSGVMNGIAGVFTPSSTSAITTMEFEPGLREDIPRALERLIPRGEAYRHEEAWHDGNGHSHVRSSLLGPGITVPVRNGSPVLGSWQQIVFLELDVRPRRRELIVHILGE
jgi:secondary thiamine-phosphate synthase enzyme